MSADGRSRLVTAGPDVVTGTMRHHRRRQLLPAGMRHRSFWVKTLMIVAAFAVGVLAGLNGPLSLALLAGAAIIAVVVADLTIGVLVFAVAQGLESLPAVSGGASVAQLVGLFLFIGWLAALLLHRAGDRAARDILASNPWLIVLLTLFMAWVAMSLLWAEDTHRALLFLLYFAFVAAIFPVVHAGIRTTRHVVLLYTMLIGTALVAGLFASRSPSPAAGERLEGAGFNPNLLGLYLLVACVLGATLACNGNLSQPARILAGVGATLAPVFFVLTASRGAFVGFIAAAVFAPLVARPGRRLVTLLAILAIALGGAAAATAFAPETAVNRLTHWDKTGSGRSDLWTIGMRMVNDKPVIGVGAGNFEVASIHYLLEPGAILRDEYIIDSPKETHNMYLEILSELGIVGLTLFVAALGYCLASVLRAIRLARAYGLSELELLSRGLLLALMSLLTAMFFSSQTFNKELYLLLATGLALLAIIRRAATAAERAR